MKKTKTLAVTLLAGFVLQQSALSQTNAADANPATTNNVSGTMAGNVVTSASPTAIPSPAVAAGGDQPVSMEASNAASSLATSTAGAGTGSTNAPTAGGTNAPAMAAELPIQFQDVPITTAIESLARLAGINYMLDPKIGYGQPDQSGQIKPEPTLSIRWENVTAQQALLALLDNYGLQLIENPKTGIARITIKEPNAPRPLITRVVQLKYASTSNMVVAVTSLLMSDDPRSRVVPDERTSQLVIVGTETGQSEVDTLLSQLDKPTRQVLIETKLVELSSNPSTTKGIDWSGTLQAQNFSFGNGVLQPTSQSTTTLPGAPVTTQISPTGASTTSSPGSSTLTSLITQPQNSLLPGGLSLNTASGLAPDMGFLSADGVKAVLSFLNQSTEAQVVSTPRLVTLDNETATISVITSYPIINTTAGTANTTGGSQITYSNIGTILEVTPRITANDYIWLKVIPDVSSFAGTQTLTSGGQAFTADLFEDRHIETQVLIPDAHTLVMGGLVQDNPNATYTKVPFLGDIPILGLAFRSENKSMQKDNLLIFITPTIVQNMDFRSSNSDFLKSQPKTMKDPMNMHTSWDSAQPRGDWSNPLPDQADSAQGTNDTNAAFAK